MSGGVDSAVAAARAAEAGHDVTGVHLALSSNPQLVPDRRARLLHAGGRRDARRAADVIGIPFYVWDLAERFHRDVVRDFVDEYARGNTPNPCLRCNEKIKFTAVLDRAVALGFDAVCTGHHARLAPAGGGHRLMRSVDPAKDQSYVLAVLTGEQLARAMFPLGDTTKDQVRSEAARARSRRGRQAGQPRHLLHRRRRHRASSRDRLGAAPGAIVDAGRHGASAGTTAATAFTVGQRRGLRIGTPPPDGRPRYVLDIEPVVEHGDRRPGGGARRGRHRGRSPGLERLPAARARSTAWSSCARTARPTRPRSGWTAPLLRITLHEPARGVARGQAAVLYDGDTVLGSATISQTSAATQPRRRPVRDVLARV